MKYLTVKEIKLACQKHKYILVQYKEGCYGAINCGVSPIALKRKSYSDEDETRIVSYSPCDFQTYISYKHPYLPPKPMSEITIDKLHPECRDEVSKGME